MKAIKVQVFPKNSSVLTTRLRIIQTRAESKSQHAGTGQDAQWPSCWPSSPPVGQKGTGPTLTILWLLKSPGILRVLAVSEILAVVQALPLRIATRNREENDSIQKKGTCLVICILQINPSIPVFFKM